METPKVFESEYKFCLILWENEPIKSGNLVKLCKERLGWKSTTTYTVIKRLSERGVIKNENTIVSSIVSKEQIQEAEIVNMVEKTFEGSLPAFISAFGRHEKLSEKEIIRLEADEVASLLDFVEHGGDHLTGQKRAYYEKTKERDLAIITLLLGTGIRVSELVGLNIDDVDFRNNGLHLIRKGRKEMTVYFGNEVADALEQYIEGSRKLIIPKEGHEDALFYSMQRRRIGVQAVQNLVKKYAKEVTPLKKITPHKLRSTYGTALYQETDDIYLVAEVLGHSDVNTTRKHYAAMSDTRRRQAAGKVVLRESVSHDSEDSNS